MATQADHTQIVLGDQNTKVEWTSSPLLIKQLSALILKVNQMDFGGRYAQS